MARNQRDENLFEETSMSFGEHLDELRICLWRAVVGLAIGFCLGLLIGDRVVQFIQQPLKAALEEFYVKQGGKQLENDLAQLQESGYPSNLVDIAKHNHMLPERVYVNPDEIRIKLGLEPPTKPTPAPDADASDTAELPDDFDRVQIYFWRASEDDRRIRSTSLNPHESFMIWVKASFVVGILISSPWVFYQIWAFVAAGLYPTERRYVYVFLPISLLLFFAGAALAFFVVFQFVLDFLFMFNESLGINPDPRISEWLSFAIMLPLGFGIAFQLPLVMFFLERIGIFTVEAYLSKWRVAILVICIISMFLTPSDPQSMLLMAAPLVVLYFLGVAMCHFLPKRKSQWDDLDEEAEAAK